MWLLTVLMVRREARVAAISSWSLTPLPDTTSCMKAMPTLAGTVGNQMLIPWCLW